MDDLSWWIREAGKWNLLSPEEEIHLSRLVQAGLKPDATERDKRIGLKAQHKFVQHNLRLVIHIAKKFHHFSSPAFSLLDFYQAGAMGLQTAAQKFDYSRGYRFSTYAYAWVRQAMQRGSYSHRRTIRLPVHQEEALRDIRNCIEEAKRSGGGTPSAAKIAEQVGIEPEKVKQLLRITLDSLSLDTKIGGTDDSCLMDLLAAEAPDDEDEMTRYQQALEYLTYEERELIEQRRMGRGFEDIGKLMGMSREKTRQRIEKVTQTMRNLCAA